MLFSTFKFPNTYRSNKADAFFTFLLLLTTVGYFFYTFKKYDIQPSDDYVYLNAGYYLSLPLHENYLGFFYPLFLKLILFFYGFKNILTDIYATYFILSIGSFLGLYYYLKSIGVAKPISYFIAVSFLFSDYQILLFPKISFFCFVLILLIFFFIQHKERNTQLFWITVLCWVLAYTRPEFFFSYILSYLILLILFVVDKKYTSKYNYLIVIFPLVLLIFGILFLNGQPVSHRGVDAFKQHFIINYLSWYPNVEIGNKDRSEFILFQKVYGNVDSMFELFSTNPTFFLKHISFNFLNYAKLSGTLLYRISIDSFLKIFIGNVKYGVLAISFLLVLLIDIKATLSALINSLKTFALKNGVIILLVLFPTLISVILIYPREHYFLFHLIIYFSIIGISLNAVVFKRKVFAPILTSTFFLLFVLGCLKNDISTQKTTNTLEMYEYILNLSTKHKLSLVSNEVFSPIFFKEKLEKYELKVFKNLPNQNIDDFLKNHQVDIIYLATKSIDASNPILKNFIERNFQDYGFKKISTYQKLNYLIFVKKGIE